MSEAVTLPPTLAAQYADFEQQISLLGPSPETSDILKLCFYAGATSVLQTLIEASMDGLSDADIARLVTQWWTEAMAYACLGQQ